MKIALVYQAGIANVFEVEHYENFHPEGGRKRRLQSVFDSCEWYARGAAAAGATVRSYVCNQAGDILNAEWYTDLESAPFSDKFSPVCTCGGRANCNVEIAKAERAGR